MVPTPGGRSQSQPVSDADGLEGNELLYSSTPDLGVKVLFSVSNKLLNQPGSKVSYTAGVSGRAWVYMWTLVWRHFFPALTAALPFEHWSPTLEGVQ